MTYSLQNEIFEFKCQSVLQTLDMISSDTEPGMATYLASLLEKVVCNVAIP